MTVALVAVIAGQLVILSWLIYGRIADARATATERVAHTATNGLLERAQYELEQTKIAMAESHRITTGLEEVLASFINATPNADLASGDVLSRLVRTANRQAEADRDRASRTAAGEIVSGPARTAAGTALPTLMRPDD